MSAEPTPLPLFDVLAKWITIRGYVMMEVVSDPTKMARGKQFIHDGLADGSFKPLIAKTFPLDGSSRPTSTWNRTSRWARLS